MQSYLHKHNIGLFGRIMQYLSPLCDAHVMWVVLLVDRLLFSTYEAASCDHEVVLVVVLQWHLLFHC